MEKRNRLRLFAFLFLSIPVYLINDLRVLFFALLLSFGLFFALRIPLRFLKGLIYANGFMFFIVATLLLFNFKENWKTALEIFLKGNTVLVLTFALVLPMGILGLTRTLKGLGVSEKFSLMVFLAYRYIHSLREEYEKIKKSAALRGFESKFSIRTYKIYGYILGALMVKTYFKARQVYKAMLCRGFGG
jgi:cobalt/nickel transport system permease protein